MEALIIFVSVVAGIVVAVVVHERRERRLEREQQQQLLDALSQAQPAVDAYLVRLKSLIP